MSDSPQDGNHAGARPKRSLRDELASLRIERRPPPRSEAPAPRPDAYRPAPAVRRGGGVRRVLSAVIWLIPLALLGGLGAYAYRQYVQLRPKPEVDVTLVQAMTTGEAEKLLTAKGYLKSHNQALVGAKVPGRVERLLIEEGMKVKSGDLLAVLEHADLAAALASRQAEVQRAEADLRQARADLDEKERKAGRMSRLLGRKSASVEEVEEAKTAYDMAAARVEAQVAAVALAQARVVEAQEAIANMSIHAPFGGTILKKEAAAGETISTMSMGGSNTRSAIANLADLEHMEVETDVSENLLARLAIGQPTEILVNAVPGRRYRGRVQRIIPMGDRTRGTIKVMVEVLDPDESLFPELVATVHFLPTTEAGADAAEVGGPALFVSRDAIVAEGGQTSAWVVDSQQVVHRRRVVVAEGTDDLARVELGLEAGEAVVLKPPKDLRDGEAVRVAE